jgi:glycosyltransferase involved in cell wall biosynthesis
VLIAGYGPSLVTFRGHLIQAMADAGHEVVALSPDPLPPLGFERLPATYESCALERAGTRPDRDLRALAKLVIQLRRLRPDVVLAYTMKPVSYGTLAAKIAGVPRRFALVTGLGYLFIPDGSRRQELVRRMALPILKMGLARTTAVFVQNPDDHHDLVEQGVLAAAHPVVRFWGSGVDRMEFPVAPVPCGPPVFLLVARLLRDKGIREFVDAARIVRLRHPAARFVLVGPPDPNPAGIPPTEVDAWRREGVVEVEGSTQDVQAYLRSCTVFVLPSYREGTPRSVLEAMSSGRAIITTDAPGCRTTVEPDVNGFLVAPRDVHTLVEAMERYATDPYLAIRHGQGSLRLVEQRFDVHRVNQAMLDAMGLTGPKPVPN